ncbi:MULTISPECIES: DUF11 domain-containing protein [unclassified Massilia]|uniref:DUF11 domain-containing protein n=1 Tax=unclassified Massilia TaxID=2609279 RepID=UPI00177A76EF|nr:MULTISPECIES: DUF11 domain-containing protein [unclassified Massilia]MBD8528608.1 DUF11 domain-containing protein [Massilia sp. CFBP 13647]MBD8671769.1 DUF11 domain-containing protein [Massilia sp. CFBP 13721]
MTSLTNRFSWLRALLLACALFAVLPAQAACVAGACISAGPRLASVNSTQSALLNPMLGGLLGSNVNLSVADWNALAGGDVKLLDFLNALKVQANVSSPTQALGTGVTLGQVNAALGVAAQLEAKTSLAGVLNALQSQLGNANATVRVGDLLKVSTDAGALAGATINSLDMLTGLIQLYNHRNMLTTPTPIGISGGALGMLGVVNNLQLYAQVIEPPVYVCGPTGSQFHSAAIRLKLKLDLVTLSPVTDALKKVAGVNSASLAIGKLDVYVEAARGEGSLAAVDAAAKAVTLQVAPGVGDIYLGSIPDSVFFNRTRRLSAADVGYGQIGQLVLNGINVAIEIKTTARGQAPFATSVTMSGSFPQTRTVSTSAAFVTGLTDSLVNNLSLRTTILTGTVLDALLVPVTNLLNGLLQPVLKLLVVDTLSPILTPVLTGVADPLLKLLGVGLGEMTVTVNGICQACDDFQLTKSANKANAVPGSVITYEIAYKNSGTTTLSGLAITDATPAFTAFVGAECGALPADLASCAIAAQPAAGGDGLVEWRFTGSLQPGASGTVKIKVRVL